MVKFEDLSKYRGELMGLAILFVILFHIGMPQSNFFYPLRRLGNIGVDMFLFVSGMGLWFSWTRSRLGKKLDGNGAMGLRQATIRFFKHRYKRIYPVWIIVASVFYIGKYVEAPGSGYSPDIPNLIANVLFNWSFWRIDDLTFWYVPATMMLYIFAPGYMELVRERPSYRWRPVASGDILQPHTDILHRHKRREMGDGKADTGERQHLDDSHHLCHEPLAMSATGIYRPQKIPVIYGAHRLHTAHRHCIAFGMQAHSRNAEKYKPGADHARHY